MREYLKFLFFAVVTIFIFVVISSAATAVFFKFRKSEPKVPSSSILKLELKGVIVDGKKFLKDLLKYRDRSEIKGVLVMIDSPGGVVGASQEIFEELKTVRDDLKKPVVVHSSSMMASGAFYSAMGASKIMVDAGTLVGSIGVIWQFANLEKLYSWAKVERYSLTTGAFKDTGAEYRPMRKDEKEYIQGMMFEVLEQFKTAVSEGRHLPIEKVTPIADGRVFTGEKALKMGLVDEIGTATDAISMIGELTGLGDEPELFEPPHPRPSIMDFITASSEDEDDSESDSLFRRPRGVEQLIKNFVINEGLTGQPLFLMPSFSASGR